MPTTEGEPLLCPKPLLKDVEGDAVSCTPKDGASRDQAFVLAFAEGPMNFSRKGLFFCRTNKQDRAGLDSGVTGTPAEQLLASRNFGYCPDRAVDRPPDRLEHNFSL